MDPHDLGRFLRGFIGFSDRGFPNSGTRQDDVEESEDNSQFEPPGPRQVDPFSVLTDPLQMHRFFEQQMDDMLRNFGGSVFRGLGVPKEDWPAITAPEHHPSESQESKRDFMLKDDDSRTMPRRDLDLDDKMDTMDFDKLFGGKNEQSISQNKPTVRSEVIPGLEHPLREPQQRGGGHWSQSWGTSMTSRTVTRGDGSSETTRTVRNSDGSQTVTVVRQVGDQRTEETRQMGPDGREVTERRLWEVPEGGRRRDEAPLGRDMVVSPPADRMFGLLWDKFFGK